MTYLDLVQAELAHTGIKVGDRVRSYDFPTFTKAAYVEGKVIAIGPWKSGCDSETCWHYHVEVDTQVYPGDYGSIRITWPPGFTVYPSVILHSVPGGSLVERIDPVPTENSVPAQEPGVTSESAIPVGEITPPEEPDSGTEASESGV